MPQPQPSSGKDPADNRSLADLSKIRDILFGEDVRDIRGEFASVHAKLNSRLDDLQAMLDSTRADLEARLESYHEAATTHANGIVDALREQTTERMDSMSKSTQSSLGELRHRGVDRSKLSEMLAELARHLKDDPTDATDA